MEARKLDLVPNANIVFKRPPILFSITPIVTAHNLFIQKNDDSLSHSCNKGALCGNSKKYFGKLMVTLANAIKIKQGKQIFLKQNLTYALILVFMLQNVKSTKTFMLDKLKMDFPQDGLVIEEFGTVRTLRNTTTEQRYSYITKQNINMS